MAFKRILYGNHCRLHNDRDTGYSVTDSLVVKELNLLIKHHIVKLTTRCILTSDSIIVINYSIQNKGVLSFIREGVIMYGKNDKGFESK